MTYFLKIPAHSEFEKGIFIPYATLLEAERQAANDLLSTDFIEGIFEADLVYDDHPYAKRLGILAHEDGFPAHATESTRVLTIKELQKKAPKHIADIEDEREKSIANYLPQLHRVLEAVKEGRLDELDEDDLAIAERLAIGPQNVAGCPGFKVVSGGTATGGAIALAAATAKTIIGVAAGTVGAPTLASFGVSFDGVTQSAVPVLCEQVSGTNATNPPGTASTSMTAKQIRGWSKGGPSSSAAYNWTTEPTVLEVYDKLHLTPAGGLFFMQFPLDREPAALATAATQFKFVGLRLTAPAVVNVHATMEFDE